ncbi:MAG: hypothetical protein U0903_20730 [Planctomycetales bacterium]
MGEFREAKTGLRPAETDSKLAKTLAPEDVRAGDYVAVLHEVVELPWFLMCHDSMTVPPEEMIRISTIPKGGGVPLRVRSVCLPFILVKTPSGGMRNLDVRRHKLARLDRSHALAVWKACKNKTEKKTGVK